MKIVVIDGQGGRMGRMLVEQLHAALPQQEIIAIGTNSIATAAMLKAGAQHGATGENPVIVNARDADIIVGPLGIVIANSLLGEITPQMALAIGQSPAQKVLVPIDRCHTCVAGVESLPMGDYIHLAVAKVLTYVVA